MTRPWKSWRLFWVDVHNWLGLLVSGVLLIYGASTIVFTFCRPRTRN